MCLVHHLLDGSMLVGIMFLFQRVEVKMINENDQVKLLLIEINVIYQLL